MSQNVNAERADMAHVPLCSDRDTGGGKGYTGFGKNWTVCGQKSNENLTLSTKTLKKNRACGANLIKNNGFEVVFRSYFTAKNERFRRAFVFKIPKFSSPVADTQLIPPLFQILPNKGGINSTISVDYYKLILSTSSSKLRKCDY